MEYKECSVAPCRPYSVVMGNFLPGHTEYYQDPTPFNVEPFRIFGNLYYVGDKKVCMHLIDTGDGLILFDSGYSHRYDALLDSIRKAGFDPKDIRYVIHSHGHFDHFGGGDRLREQFGAEILMSRVDTELLREYEPRALVHLSAQKEDVICWPDRTLEDGEEITLGNTKILCRLAPGHTFGTMAFFFDVTEGETTLRVGYFGGIGFLTVYKEYCREYRLPENKCQKLKETLVALRSEKVDILIGNHPNQNCTMEKREYMIRHPEHNPFINPEAWGILLDTLEERRTEFEQLGY